MGLDMYLKAKKRLKESIDFPKDLSAKFKRQDEGIMIGVWEVGYWRKFYDLHYYIAETIYEPNENDNCNEKYLEPEQLENIIGFLKEYKQKAEDGEYNETYFGSKKEAIAYVDKAIQIFESAYDLSGEYDFVYYAWY